MQTYSLKYDASRAHVRLRKTIIVKHRAVLTMCMMWFVCSDP